MPESPVSERKTMTMRSRDNKWEKRAAGSLAVALDRLFGCRARSGLGILVYHRVAPLAPGLPEPTINVPPDRFRMQLSGLLARGFAILPLARLLEYHSRGIAFHSRTTAVTFDDGFESVHAWAWPVLKELNVPATVFLSTAFLDSNEPFPFDPWGMKYRHCAPAQTYRPLTSMQCREMLDHGLVDFGSHTHTHADFRGRPAEFASDLQASLEVLRTRFGQDRVSFAFPFGRPHLGYAGEEMMETLRRSGVSCALTTEAVLVTPGCDPFGWGRFNAYQWDDGASLAAKCNGWYGWAPRLQETIAGVRCRLLPGRDRWQ